eukprot:6098865-Pyramimonas_sp.AAC.1
MWCTARFFCRTMLRMSLDDDSWVPGAKVSVKVSPNTWWWPKATSRALYLSKLPSGLSLRL